MESCNLWLKRHFHALDIDKHIKLHCLIRPGSADLIDLYLRQEQTGIALANDTSCGVGYAPLNELEQIVLQVEQYLNSPTVKALHPETGEDIKVMGVQRDDTIELTIACAFIDRYIMDVADYVSKKVAVSELALETARQMTDKGVIVELNSADDISRSSLYLTVTGTSAEAGDDGEVGRGNRVNGLITPYRPMNMEAAAGKNPITHVGKLYNIAAKQVAQTAVEELPEINEIYCYLVSRIGHPINEPHLVDIHVRLREDVTLETIKPRLADIVHDKLMAMDRIRDGLVAATIPVY